jgi:hypothetical protein
VSFSSKAQIIREAADAVRFETLAKGERNTAIRDWVEQRYPDFDWSKNSAALIAGALKSKRWKAHRPLTRPPAGADSVARNLEPALRLVLRAGSFAAAREQVYGVESNPLLEFIVSAGGIAQALSLLDEAESRVYGHTDLHEMADSAVKEWRDESSA